MNESFAVSILLKRSLCECARRGRSISKDGGLLWLMFFMIEAMLNIVGENNPGIVKALEKILLSHVFPR